MQPRSSIIIAGDEVVFPIKTVALDEQGRRRTLCLEEFDYVVMEVKQADGNLLFTVIGKITNAYKGYIVFDLRKEQTSQEPGIYQYQVRGLRNEVLRGVTLVNSVLQIKERV